MWQLPGWFGAQGSANKGSQRAGDSQDRSGDRSALRHTGDREEAGSSELQVAAARGNVLLRVKWKPKDRSKSKAESGV